MGLSKVLLDELLPQFFLRRQVLCANKINGDSQEQITQAILGLNLLNKEQITLIIDSTGGDVFPGHWIADAVSCSEAPVHGLVVGCAYSAAFWVLQNCRWRVCYPHAKLMCHGSDLGRIRCDQPDFQEQVEKIIRAHQNKLKFLVRRTHQPLKRWQEWSRTEHCFSAQEALGLGIIDEIIKPKPIPGLDDR